MLRVVEVWESKTEWGELGMYNIILKPKYIRQLRICLVVVRNFGQDCGINTILIALTHRHTKQMD
jgi:hypothetical protein